MKDAGAAPRKCIRRRKCKFQSVAHQRAAEHSPGGVPHLRLGGDGIFQARFVHQYKSLVGLAREVARDAPGLQERLDLLVARRGALRLLRGVLRRLALGLSRGLDFCRVREEPFLGLSLRA